MRPDRPHRRIQLNHAVSKDPLSAGPFERFVHVLAWRVPVFVCQVQQKWISTCHCPCQKRCRGSRVLGIERQKVDRLPHDGFIVHQWQWRTPVVGVLERRFWFRLLYARPMSTDNGTPQYSLNSCWNGMCSHCCPRCYLPIAIVRYRTRCSAVPEVVSFLGGPNMASHAKVRWVP